jgi:Sensors of blue-light using FAD
VTYQIIYSSRATQPMTEADLEAILVDARQGNEAKRVTGALIFVDGHFLQIVEGDKPTVLGLMANIARDTRHADVTVFSELEVEAPMFRTWSMAYLGAGPDDLSAWAELPGATSIGSILEEVGRAPARASRIALGILKALSG